MAVASYRLRSVIVVRYDLAKSVVACPRMSPRRQYFGLMSSSFRCVLGRIMCFAKVHPSWDDACVRCMMSSSLAMMPTPSGLCRLCCSGSSFWLGS